MFRIPPCTLAAFLALNAGAPPAITVTAQGRFLSTGAILTASLPGARSPWTLDNGAILSGQGTASIVFQAGAPGPLALACGGASAVFTVLPPPRADIFAPARVHAGDTFAASMPTPGNRSWLWDPVAGAGAAPGFEPGANPVRVTAASAGTLRLSGTVEDLAGASAGASATVAVVRGDFANPGWVTAEWGQVSLVPLPTGRVLVLGEGREAGLFDPLTQAWRPAAPMLAVHGPGQAATLLADGKVLVAGGMGPDGVVDAAETYDPASDRWSAAGTLVQARCGHSATLLRDGTVLVLGGYDARGDLLAGPEKYDPGTGRWTILTPAARVAPVARCQHTATLLANGMVLVAGGTGAGGEALSSTEIYDPASNAWGPAAPLRARRCLHSATLLEDGSVLAAGGSDGAGDLASAERYLPARNAWLPAAAMAVPRAGHGAARLKDGRVVVVGGTSGPASLKAAERYDPGAGPGQGDAWTPQPPLLQARSQLAVAVLEDGRILVTGGYDLNSPVGSPELLNPGSRAWASAAGGDARARSGHAAVLLQDGTLLVVGGAAGAQRFDPATLAWTQAGGPAPGQAPSATPLPDGRVLVAGGNDPGGTPLASAAVYDPQTGLWSPAGTLAQGRTGHTASLLADGTVLVAGGSGGPGQEALESAERFDGGLWLPVPPMATGRQGHTATVLPDGTVLLLGGQDRQGAALSSAERYDPAADAWTVPPPPMPFPRTGHTATLLPNGKVLVVGGFQDDSATASVACFDPARNQWTLAASLGTPRGGHTATLVGGKVLVTGGTDLQQPLASAELYDPQSDTWTDGGTMDAPRSGHTATLLGDGATVAVFGGEPLQANLEFWK